MVLTPHIEFLLCFPRGKPQTKQRKIQKPNRPRASLAGNGECMAARSQLFWIRMWACSRWSWVHLRSAQTSTSFVLPSSVQPVRVTRFCRGGEQDPYMTYLTCIVICHEDLIFTVSAQCHVILIFVKVKLIDHVDSSFSSLGLQFCLNSFVAFNR